MSRPRLSLAAALAAVLALGVATASPAGGSKGSAVRTGSDCVWTLHKKKVTVRKKVGKKGHRQIRKIKRTKRWWTCESLPPTSNRLLVRASEWSLVLSRPGVDAGELTVQLKNEGEDPHNLQLELAGGPSYAFEDVDPGEISEGTVQLTAGSWKLYCSLPGHEEAGMRANLVVD